MKNRNRERKRLKAIAHAKTRCFWNWDHQRQIQVYHCYDEKDPNGLSWWDDVAFRIGKQKVVVGWIHPRTKYNDDASNITHDMVEWPKDREGLFGDSVKIYRKVGKSRKKVSCLISNGTNTEYRVALNKWTALQEDIKANGSIEVRPYIKVEQLDYCRWVDVCIPVEVRNEDELKAMADLVKQIVTGKVTLDELFPGYVYTKDNWKMENPCDQSTVGPK